VAGDGQRAAVLGARAGVIPRLPGRFWLAFAAACVGALAVEHLSQRVIRSDDPRQAGLAQSVFDLSGFYQRLVSAGPRKPAARFTTIVEIDGDSDPDVVGLFNLCRQREFLARLVRGVARGSPALIVIDKYFRHDACAEDDPGTVALRAAIDDVGRSTAVVVGRRIAVEARDAPLLPALLRPRPGLRLSDGIVNLDPDSRRLPLQWPVRPPADEGPGAPAWRPTLAVAAARAYDSELLARSPRLARLIDHHAHPYISFLTPEKFTRLPAGGVACRHGAREGGDCVQRAPESELERLRHRIVIIGERSGDVDEHRSVIGLVPGYVLQANYVEALLDERYFEPAPWLDYVLGLGIFAALELVLVVFHASAWRIVVGIASVVAGTMLVLYLVLVHVGWYVNPLPVSALALVIQLTHLLFDRARRLTREHA
jgi:CHASE2 domain-containing sensor protein